jgi:AcrR family transcriptional regulator
MAVQAGRRVPLTRERVLQAAMALADEGGIEALSMRKLGQSLGVEAMSLYNHVANKEDILAGISDLVMSEIELPSGEEEWEADLRRFARSAHDTLVRHPWACNYIMLSTRVFPGRLRYMEALLGRLRQAGFSPAQTYHAYHAIDSHILGFTLWQLGHALPANVPQVTTREEIRRFITRLLPQVSVDELPYLVEHAEWHLLDGPHKHESAFDFGLRMVLEGLRRMLESGG